MYANSPVQPLDTIRASVYGIGMNTQTDPTVKARREEATNAFLNKAHRLWHEARGLDVCLSRSCQHPWYPR